MKKRFLLLVVCGLTFFHQRATAQATDLRIKGASVNSSAGSTARCAAVDASGNTYIAGAFRGSVAFGSTTLVSATSTSTDIFIAKCNAAGVFQWAKRAGGTSLDVAVGIAVSGSDVYITGSFTGTANFNTPSATGSNEITSAGNLDVFIAKYDDTGVFQWTKRAGGAAGIDVANGIAVSGSDVYITGAFTGTADFNNPSASGSNEIAAGGGVDIFLAKYDATGTFQWAKRAGGAASVGATVASRGVAILGSDVYITGSFSATADFNNPSASGSNEIVSAGGDDIFLAKYDATGAFQWAKRAGGTDNDRANGIAISGSGDIYIAGTFTGTADFNNPSASGSNEIVSAGSNDIFTAKFDATGAFEWAKRAGGTAPEQPFSIAVSGNFVYITGNFSGTINFNNPSAAGSNEITGVGSSTDVFLACYDNAGTFQLAKRAGGSGGDTGYGIAASSSGPTVVGYFNGTANFNTPSATGSNELTTVSGNTPPIGGGGDAFLAHYAVCPSSVALASDDADNSIASGTSVIFTAPPTNGGTTPTYVWKKNDVVIVGETGATYTTTTLANGDKIKVEMMSSEECALPKTAISPEITMTIASVLSVEILSFSGKNTEGGNLLTWTTANEVNNKGFQVERITDSPEHSGWTILGFVNAKGKAADYNFVDNSPLSTSYYRLRQIDNDGKETLSKVISVSQKSNNKLKVYPNPVSNILTIEFGSPLWGLGADVFQIYNLLGQQVMNGKTPPSGAGKLDVSALPEGTYFLKVGVEQVKFIKQ